MGAVRVYECEGGIGGRVVCDGSQRPMPARYRMMGAVARQQLFLIDSFGFIFRAYHARARSGAPPMRTSTGFSTEAVYIFNNMLRKLSKQYNPAYIAAIFESEGPTHRLQEFAEYKANR